MATPDTKPTEEQLAQAPPPSPYPSPPPPVQPGPRGPARSGGSHAGRWVAIAVAVVLIAALAVVAVNAVNEDRKGAGDSGAAYEKAERAWDRLDDKMVNTFNRTDRVVGVTFACLSRASNIDPYGGPRLARCVPVGERSAATLRRSGDGLEKTYRASPAYLRRIYGPAYRGTERVLAVHARYVDAMTTWARVHGASSYAGAVEFGAIRAAREEVVAADKKHEPLIGQARRRWKRYAEQRWGVEFR